MYARKAGDDEMEENVRLGRLRCVQKDRNYRYSDIFTALRGERRKRERCSVVEKPGKLKNLGNIKDVLTRQSGERG